MSRTDSRALLGFESNFKVPMSVTIPAVRRSAPAAAIRADLELGRTRNGFATDDVYANKILVQFEEIGVKQLGEPSEVELERRKPELMGPASNCGWHAQVSGVGHCVRQP